MALKESLLTYLGPIHLIDFSLCMLTINPPFTQKLVTEVHKVLYLDEFYSAYICLAYALLLGTNFYLTMKPDETDQLKKEPFQANQGLVVAFRE